MKIFYIKQKALDSLQQDISDNIEKYQSASPWIEQYFINKETPKYYFDTGIEVADYILIPGGPETDFQNAKTVFEAFKETLNPVQASDLRLWSYLAHVQHWDYMTTRWNINIPDEEAEREVDIAKKSTREKAVDRVKSRYFFGESRSKAFVRQGIARLFWSAYLTYDEASENPYEYTEYFFSKQDIFTSITERSYARNKVLILAALKELKKHPSLTRNDIRLFLAKLNQAGAITVLDFLNSEQAARLCEELMDEVLHVPCIQEGSEFKAYHTVTGNAYGPTFKILHGKTTAIGKPITVKPQCLIGKKEGSKITIAGQTYVIKEILQQSANIDEAVPNVV